MTRTIFRIALPLLVCATAWAEGPTFEVASMKVSPPPGSVIRVGCSGGPGTASPGQIDCSRMNLRSLLMRAYDLKQYQVAGPEWMTEEVYDVTAKVPAGATKEDVQKMWQDLLAGRLKVQAHRESKEMPIYALIVAKGGPKLQPADDAPAVAPSNAGGGWGTGNAAGGGGVAHATLAEAPAGASRSNSGRFSGPRMEMSQVVTALTFHVDRPVLDMTNLTGRYKILVEWNEEGMLGVNGKPVANTVFAALEQDLGLKLDARKAPIDLLVVDHAEKVPTEN